MLYNISLKEVIEYYPLQVIADSPDEAVEKAWELIDNAKDKNVYLHDIMTSGIAYE